MRRAFTVIELIAVMVVAIVLGAVILGVLLPARGGRGGSHTQLRDSTQIRGILQSMVVWANNNNGEYPLPSALDAGNLTVKETGRTNTTANIFSILIFNGHFQPELCVSPSESNRAISVDADYAYNSPVTAVTPASALWDPGFAADFTAPGGGNFSYGHLQPSGTRGTPSRPGIGAVEPTGRLRAWRDTFSTLEAVLGNRGPEIASVASDYTPTLKNKSSNTFLIHGGRSAWEGNIGYNDGHVAFETSLQATGSLRYSSPSGERWDSFFFDEPDDTNQSNIFLGIFTTAGEKPSEFNGIGD